MLSPQFVPPRSFVEELLERNWEKKPAIFRRPFPSPLYSPEEVFRCLVAGRQRILRDAGGPPAFRFYRGNAMLLSDVAPFEPRAADGSLDGYIDRVRRSAGERFGLTANEFHCGDPAIADRMRGLLRPIYEQRGIGPHFAESFCFIGNYAVSPFGVHIDSASNLTYIVRGKKRYRLFERSVLDGATEVHSTSQYGPYLDRGLTLEAEEGDLVYWPAGTWHVAEHPSTEVATSVGLVVYMARLPVEILSTATTRALRRRGPAPAPLHFDATPARAGGEVASLPTSLAEVVRVGSGFASEVELETRRLWTERLSCLSLNESLLPAPRPSIVSGQSIGMSPERPFLWSRSGDLIVVACQGDSVVLPNREFVVQVLQRLLEGTPCGIEALQSMSSDPAEVTRMIEELATIRAVTVG